VSLVRVGIQHEVVRDRQGFVVMPFKRLLVFSVITLYIFNG